MTRPTTPGRGRPRARRALLALSSALASGLAAPVAAQLTPPAPVRQSVDANGVDLFAGTMNVDAPALTIGGEQGLSYYKLNRGSGWTDNLIAAIYILDTSVTVSLGGVSDGFTVADGVHTSTERNGATLAFDSGTNIYTYTRADGTVVRFGKNRSNSTPYYANGGRAIDIVSPSGDKLVYAYESIAYCSGTKVVRGEPTCAGRLNAHRIASLRNSFGYQILFNYTPIPEHDPNDPNDRPDLATWSRLTGVSARNLASSPTATVASQGFGANAGVITVIDPLQRTTRFRMNGGAVVGITKPGGTAEDMTIAYTDSRVSSITTPTGTVAYTASDANGERTVTVTNPLSHATVYVFDISSKRLKRLTRKLGEVEHVWKWTYDDAGRLKTATAPEGDYVEYERDDARGVVTKTLAVPKSGDRTKAITTSATFPACTEANRRYCNQPETTTDARGGVTNYQYDPDHGGVTKVTGPAPTLDPQAARPEVRYGYTMLQAYFDVGSGMVASGEPVARLTSMSMCRTKKPEQCVGAADETKRTIGYGPQAAGTGNNLLPVSETVAAGAGGVPSTTTTSYDAAGNAITVDGPLTDDDTTRYRFDTARQLIGVIGPDPDGGDELRHRAQRITLDPKGQVTLVEQGTVTNQSDTAWSAFTSLQSVATRYDVAGRKQSEFLQAGGTTYSLTQWAYDTAGRLRCVAQRMDRSAFQAHLDSPDACVKGADGEDGPDRIARYDHNALDQVTAATSGLDTAAAATERAGYTRNGQLEWVADGENNRTVYAYDGFDRIKFTYYPKPAVGADAKNDADYEELVYNAAGDVEERRLRDGRRIRFGYDRLGRMTSRDLPADEADGSFRYDLLGRMIEASDANGSFTFGYDALGRLTSQGQSLGHVIASEYDAAGRRTKLSWTGGHHVTYEHLVTGEMTVARENGAAKLFELGYDQLGRRAKLTRGNGVTTTYGYDGAPWLTSLDLDLAGTAHDQEITLAHNAAGQIKGRTALNGLYAWDGHANADRGYASNGLNQVTAAGPVAIAHDARGNVSGIGGTAYGYNARDLLTTFPGGSVRYDALDRLHDVSAEARFNLRDGSEVATELGHDGQVKRRYVRGPGMDEPIVWYEGAGTGDKRWLVADERGSVVAVTDGGGAPLAINAYDEYGKPAAGNQGRFQYTGQAWLPSLGLYDYKARMYAPSLGRFMQKDPIGYADGMNLYGYVGGDPVNKVDPSGLRQFCFRQASGQKSVWNGKDFVITLNYMCYELPENGGFGRAEGGGGGRVRPTPPQLVPAVGATPQRGPCPAVPGPGPGKDELDRNIRNARNDRPGSRAGPQDGGLINALRLRRDVTGPQNYKADPRYGDPGAPFGNFNYGANAQARGFSLDTTLRASDAADRWENLWEEGDPFSGDDLQDVTDVTNGWNYAARGCEKR